MKRKVLTIMFVGVLSISSLAGCGNDTKPKSEETAIQTETESIEKDVVEETEETIKTEEKESEITETEVKATEVPKEEVTSTSVPETKDKPKESKTEKTTKPTEKPTEAPTKAPHQHSYSSSVTKNPTCSESGIKTYQCSCGDSYTENIPMTEHSWVEQTQTVNHEAEGRYEEVPVYENVAYYHCACGLDWFDDDEYTLHSWEAGCSCECFSKKVQTGTESKWITTKDAWTETIVTGYKCSVCGAVK